MLGLQTPVFICGPVPWTCVQAGKNHLTLCACKKKYSYTVKKKKIFFTNNAWPANPCLHMWPSAMDMCTGRQKSPGSLCLQKETFICCKRRKNIFHELCLACKPLSSYVAQYHGHVYMQAKITRLFVPAKGNIYML